MFEKEKPYNFKKKSSPNPAIPFFKIPKSARETKEIKVSVGILGENIGIRERILRASSLITDKNV
jgi:hypothetical protein